MSEKLQERPTIRVMSYKLEWKDGNQGLQEN